MQRKLGDKKMVIQQTQQKVKEENKYAVTGKLIVVEGIDGIR